MVLIETRNIVAFLNVTDDSAVASRSLKVISISTSHRVFARAVALASGGAAGEMRKS